MSELVIRYSGRESSDLNIFASNLCTKGPERNGRHGEPEKLAA